MGREPGCPPESGSGESETGLAPFVLRAHGLGRCLVLLGVGGLLSGHLPFGFCWWLLASPVTGAHSSFTRTHFSSLIVNPYPPPKAPSSSAIVVIVAVQSLSRLQLLAAPWTAAHQGSLSFPISRSLLKHMSIELVMPSNHLILCRPLLLLPSVFPSIRVVSNESALPIRWLKLNHYLLPKTTSATARRPSSSILCLVRTAPLEQLPVWGMLAYSACSLPSPLCLCLRDPWSRRCLQQG